MDVAVKRLRGQVSHLLNRVNPGRVGWFRQGDYVTFRVGGFVHAPSPPVLLARHNYECEAIRSVLMGHEVEASLEVGCGYGRLSPVFAEFTAHHTAVDVNESALATAQACYPMLTFRRASATELPFPDDTFDLVESWTVLQHLRPDLFQRAAAEILRVLKPTGSLLFCEETRYAHVDQSHLRDRHTWHREIEEYETAFQPLQLVTHYYLEKIDRIPDIESPGELMVFRPAP